MKAVGYLHFFLYQNTVELIFKKSSLGSIMPVSKIYDFEQMISPKEVHRSDVMRVV